MGTYWDDFIMKYYDEICYSNVNASGLIILLEAFYFYIKKDDANEKAAIDRYKNIERK